jgi:hypothetical protein
MALSRLETAIAKRVEVIAAQDELVAEANARVATAVLQVVGISGLTRATIILGVPKGLLRRQLASAKQGCSK